jgi:predicted ribosomally synthesized peptide with SipW-like signal peptide
LKKLAVSLVSIAVVSILAIGATKAYFSDQVTAAGNTFASGTLYLTLNSKNGPVQPYTITNIAPGAWAPTGTIYLKNTGTVDGHAWLEITKVRTSGNGALGNLVGVSFQENIPNGQKLNGFKPINDVANHPMDLFDIKAGATVPLTLYAVWPNGSPATDNRAQGETITFNVVFNLDQKMCGSFVCSNDHRH